MGLSFGNGILLLLLVAAVVSMVSRRLNLPYSVGLVAAGMILALLPFTPRVNLTRDLIFDGLLPPLVFEAAFYLNWSELRREMPVVLTLATAGVAASGAVTALGMHYLAGWEWSSAVVFGSLIAATDPVSVIATFRDAKAHGRLCLLIESESLINDGTAAVAFGAALLFSSGHAITAAGLAMNVLSVIAGAIVCGAAVGGAALFLARRTDDHLVELTFTTVAAYGSFLLAERLQFSGVLATIVAGLIIGNRAFARGGNPGFAHEGNPAAPAVFSDRGREALQAFWDYAAFFANSLIFLLIGMNETVQRFRSVLMPCAIAVLVVLVSRAVAVFPFCALFARSGLRIRAGHQYALFWGGLRGALALALALGLPEELPRRAEIITVSFAVVAFSIFVQGMTMRPLLRAIGEIPRNRTLAGSVKQTLPE